MSLVIQSLTPQELQEVSASVRLTEGSTALVDNLLNDAERQLLALAPTLHRELCSLAGRIAHLEHGPAILGPSDFAKTHLVQGANMKTFVIAHVADLLPSCGVDLSAFAHIDHNGEPAVVLGPAVAWRSRWVSRDWYFMEDAARLTSLWAEAQAQARVQAERDRQEREYRQRVREVQAREAESTGERLRRLEARLAEIEGISPL
jgi:hypothetical protein